MIHSHKALGRQSPGTESGRRGPGAAAGEAERVLNRDRVSVWEEEKVLQINCTVSTA